MWAVVPSARVIQYGLGPIGTGIAELSLARGHRLTGAADVDPAKTGRPLGELVPGAPAGVVVERPPLDAPARRADLVLHSTQSRLAQVIEQLLPLLDAGLPVISTCEELAYPWHHHPSEAAALDAMARARGVAVVGLGVNPGFVMDVLPAILAAPCRSIERISVRRVVDVGLRRLPLQQKAGVGLTPEAFAEGASAGRIGHVGLLQSVAMLADALGWRLDGIEETVEPVAGPDRTVRGLHQVCRGIREGRTVITLDLAMTAGASDPRDTVSIDGTPPMRMEIAGGVQGDQATCAIVVNAIPQILAASPGLRVATELPPVSARPR